MYVDLPTPAEVRSLLEVTGRTCVSIYMSATPQADDADAERIAFKNLASDALAQLDAAGIEKQEVATFAEALVDIESDPFFWRHQANSLAVFATSDEVASTVSRVGSTRQCSSPTGSWSSGCCAP